MIAQVTGWYVVDVEAGVYSLFPSFSGSFLPAKMSFCSFDFAWIGSHVIDFAVIVFSFLFVDIFDTVGTLIGIAQKGNLLDEQGKLPRAKQALLSDAFGTIFGALVGTSTVTSYVESSAGVAAGGRTGLSALVTAILFIVALPLSPIFLAIPGFATTPALVWVGLLMMSSIKKMSFDGDIADVVSGYMAIIMIKGRKVLLVDDVISTGESLASMETLVNQVGGNIVGRMAVLAEGDAADRDDILFLEKLPLFNADGSVK